jgi:hypothetical protein
LAEKAANGKHVANDAQNKDGGQQDGLRVLDC